MAGALPASLAFQPLGEELKRDLDEVFGCWAKLDYNPFTRKVVAIVDNDLLSIDVKDGSRQLLHDVTYHDGRTFISTVDSTNGDVIVAYEDDYDDENPAFYRISSDGEVSDVPLAALELEDYLARRLVLADNGELVVFAARLQDGPFPTSKPEEVGFYDSDWHFRRWSRRSSLLEPALCCLTNGVGMFCASYRGTGIIEFNFERNETRWVVGNYDQGCEDGVGFHARFEDLELLAVNRKFAVVSAAAQDRWQRRLVIIDLATGEAATVPTLGLELVHVVGACLSDEGLYVAVCPQAGDRLQFLHAPLAAAGSRGGLLAAVSALDLETPARPIRFKLASGKALELDRRLLVARSEYFAAMLNSGFAEGSSHVVDLSGDADADRGSVAVLLRFILCDRWVGREDDMDLALKVRSLADRYQLPRLVALAEGHLQRMLTPRSVLSLLGRLVGAGGAGGVLEQACWSLFTRHREDIVNNHEEELDRIIESNPRLAKRLIVELSKDSRSAKRARV